MLFQDLALRLLNTLMTRVDYIKLYFDMSAIRNKNKYEKK